MVILVKGKGSKADVTENSLILLPMILHCCENIYCMF